MTNLINVELTTLKAEELRTIAKEFKMVGAWKAKKSDMVEFLQNIKEEQIKAEQSKKKTNKKKTIEILKNGKVIAVIEGLIETFKYVEEKQICNQGWVKHSLKTGKVTVAGRKYKMGGYLFRYAA